MFELGLGSICSSDGIELVHLKQERLSTLGMTNATRLPVKLWFHVISFVLEENVLLSSLQTYHLSSLGLHRKSALVITYLDFNIFIFSRVNTSDTSKLVWSVFYNASNFLR